MRSYLNATFGANPDEDDEMQDEFSTTVGGELAAS